MNPYSTLGIEATASPAAVKKAYRRKAAQSHPDKGGKEEEFHRIHAAYKLLSDPGKRDRYDRTGDVEIADGWERIIADNFANLILLVLETEPSDVTDAATSALTHNKAQLADSAAKLRREIEKQRKHIARVKLTDNGHDPVTTALQSRISALDQKIRETERETMICEELEKQLHRYEFTKTEPTSPCRTSIYAGAQLSTWA